jgi:signal transduction histidine kinase
MGVHVMYSKTSTTAGPPEILIVEDSPTQAMELQLTLEQYGFRTSIVGNGKEALSWLLQSKSPTLVISDIVMPEIDGYGLCRAVRQNEKLKDIPFILLSYLSDTADILKGLASGASNFIVKPYNAEYLISYIRKELSREHQGESEYSQAPLALEYGGKEYRVNSNVRQIIDILLATYGTAVHKNEELIRAENELRQLNENLEEKVRERTAELTAEIAERRRVEEELRQKSQELTAYSIKLEQSNRDLQDFAFVASHDLQEPVRKIRTFGDLLETRCGELLDEKSRGYLERMSRSAGRMQDLILSLLKYSRVASSLELFPRVDLMQSVKEALSDLKILCEEAGARIDIENLPKIEADPVLMRQLFQNLLGNALKYRGEKPPVIRVYSKPSGCDGFHEIRVEDNGIGFDECYLNNIFKPFQRLHGRNASYQGTGMGLAICRRIVERHGGSITAHSKPDHGAVFIMILPERQSGHPH